jgi:hypothetical protein
MSPLFGSELTIVYFVFPKRTPFYHGFLSLAVRQERTKMAPPVGSTRALFTWAPEKNLSPSKKPVALMEIQWPADNKVPAASHGNHLDGPGQK